MTEKELYQKERKRVNQILRRLRKEGYLIDVDLPTIKDDFNKSISYFKGITPKKLRESYLIDTETGELVITNQFENFIDDEQIYQQVVNNIIDKIEGMELNDTDPWFFSLSEKNKVDLIDLIYSATQKYEIKQVALNYQQNATRINYLIDRVIYDSKQEVVDQALTELAMIFSSIPFSFEDFEKMEG